MEKNSEWVTLDVLLQHGEYPVVTDLIKLGQDVNTAIWSLQRLKTRIDEAVAKETGMKIERRIIQNEKN